MRSHQLKINNENSDRLLPILKMQNYKKKVGWSVSETQQLITLHIMSGGFHPSTHPTR